MGQNPLMERLIQKSYFTHNLVRRCVAYLLRLNFKYHLLEWKYNDRNLY
jgi:hypothetical protein